MYFKDFDAWFGVKKHIESEERKVYIRAGEIRWIAFGVNVGSELDGKGFFYAAGACSACNRVALGACDSFVNKGQRYRGVYAI